jgi:hypothetical protein
MPFRMFLHGGYRVAGVLLPGRDYQLVRVSRPGRSAAFRLPFGEHAAMVRQGFRQRGVEASGCWSRRESPCTGECPDRGVSLAR